MACFAASGSLEFNSAANSGFCIAKAVSTTPDDFSFAIDESITAIRFSACPGLYSGFSDDVFLYLGAVATTFVTGIPFSS